MIEEQRELVSARESHHPSLLSISVKLSEAQQVQQAVVSVEEKVRWGQSSEAFRN
jgi:hypothetical protein